jgi:hypothetical protein
MIIVSVPMLATGAAAMVRATPAISAGATADRPLLQRVTVVCGQNGCAPVQTKRVQHGKYHP